MNEKYQINELSEENMKLIYDVYEWEHHLNELYSVNQQEKISEEVEIVNKFFLNKYRIDIKAYFAETVNGRTIIKLYPELDSDDDEIFNSIKNIKREISNYYINSSFWAFDNIDYSDPEACKKLVKYALISNPTSIVLTDINQVEFLDDISVINLAKDLKKSRTIYAEKSQFI